MRGSKAVFCAVVWLAAAAPAAALTAEVVEWGITDLERHPGKPDPDYRGLLYEMRAVRYVERTDRIEARLCRSFGITVRLSGEPDEMPARVEVRVAHPLFVRPDGASSSEDRFRSGVFDGLTRIGFSFDHAWEMQPGVWAMIVLVEGREIARQPFTITMPPSGAIRSECGVVS